MTIPNFFKYNIVVDSQKIGEICAPCKKVAQLAWEAYELQLVYPNAKIKLAGINLKKGKNCND